MNQTECALATFSNMERDITSTIQHMVRPSALRSKSPTPTLSAQAAASINDVGITVPGAVSEQKFEVGPWFPTDGQVHVMVLRLMGQVGNTRVEQPVTVKTKTECPTCGTKNKFGTKFCREYGTGLSLL